MYTIKCVICGQMFNSVVKNRLTCSPECRNAMRAEYAKKRWERLRAEHKLDSRKCVVCGKEFIPLKEENVTCSHKCSVINSRRKEKEKRRKARAARLTLLDKKEYVSNNGKLKERKCIQCGKVFRPFSITVDKYGIHPAGLNFCCYQCCENYFKGASRNENNRHDLCCS